VVGEPPDVDPIKTICSSTLTTTASASSATAGPKLSRFKLRKNPLHRAIGLFKFEGLEGETITLKIAAEEEESVETVVEESSVNELDNPWLNWRGKGRVFLGMRDSIPGLDFRVRKKDHLPLTLSATLPANGTYYVMLIRPLLRFYRTDYCLTLESDFQDSQAWKTFDVAWPNDESEDCSASASAAESEEVQESTETVDSVSADDGTGPVTLSTTAIEPTSAPPEEITVEETSDVPPEEVPPAENPREPADVDEDDGAVAPTDAGNTAVEEEVEVIPEEPVTEGGGDSEVVQTAADDTALEEPVEVIPEEPATGGDDTEVVQTDTGDTLVEELVGETVDEPVVATPVEANPAVDDDGETESGEDSIDEVGDDPMEDPSPVKG
jgi:hypothetical protein